MVLAGLSGPSSQSSLQLDNLEDAGFASWNWGPGKSHVQFWGPLLSGCWEACGPVAMNWPGTGPFLDAECFIQ